MSAERFLSLLERHRTTADRFGLRVKRVYRVITSNDRADLTGNSYDSEVEILNNGTPPAVRELKAEELALTGYGSGSLLVGPLTPDHAGGGTSFEELRPELAEGELLRYRVTGPGHASTGDTYAVRRSDTSSALHFTVTLERVGDGRPQ